MPDTIDDDRLADLFTQFRTDARAEIVPPGATQTHRTVRRRRQTARFVSVAAALVVVGAAGAVATTTPHGGTTATDTDTDTQQSLSPDERGEAALAKLGFSSSTENPPDHLLAMRPGIAYGVLDANAASVDYQFGTAADPLAAGDYTLVAYCAGKGGITIAWRTGSDSGVTDKVPCGESAPAGGAIHTTDTIAITISPYGEAATDRPGFVVAITDPREVLARTRANMAEPGSLSGSSAVINFPLSNQDDSGHGQGRYRLTFACVGYESQLTLEFAAGEAVSGAAVTCTEKGTVKTVTVTATKDDDPLVVSATPKGNQEAAIAYRIDRV
jgi:hypothetical protein